jgi:hypothetical protein
MPEAHPAPAARQKWWALALCCVLALYWGWGYRDASSWGWDESMHAELPAARLVLATQAVRPAAAMAAVHDSDRYPIVYPAMLAVPQFFFGISEDNARRSSVAIWCLALFALWLLGVELARAARGPDGEPRPNEAFVPWIALAFGAASPLGLALGYSLFLEAPFVLTGALALRGWLRRGAHLGEDGRFVRERRAGAWFVLAFFTKFNYSLLLALGCGADWLLEGISEVRAGRGREFARRTAHLLMLPAIFGVWWFILPLPHGLETAAEHREAFAEFLSGNQDGNEQGNEWRILYLACFFSLSVRALILQGVGALAGLRRLTRGTRVLWLTAIATFVPIWTHPFFLERFWLPLGISLWPLAALGIANVLPRARVGAAAIVVALAALVAVDPTSDALKLAGHYGMISSDPEKQDDEVELYKRSELVRMGSLERGRPALRRPALKREERETLDELIASVTGPMEKVAWLGISSEYSPAVLHLGLLENGGSPGRFLRDAHMPLDLEFRGNRGYGEWTDQDLLEWASDFDLVLMSDPVDFNQREGRAYMRPLQQRLCEDLGWTEERVGLVDRERLLRDPLRIRIFAVRPPR